ncbi:MAG: hypothetical protein V1720_08445 [bacterium]
MKLIIRIFLPILGVFILALLLISIPLPDIFPERLSRGRNLLAAITIGVCGLFYLVYIARYVSKAFMRQGAVLDPVCLKKGMTSENYQVYGKHYSGVFSGRKIDVYYTPARKLAVPLMNIYLNTTSNVRLAVGEKKPLMDCSDCPKIEPGYPELDHLQIFSGDSVWVQKFFDNPDNRTLINRLISGWKEIGLRELYLQPGKIWLHSHPYFKVTYNDIEQWFDALPVLADAVEKIDKTLK